MTAYMMVRKEIAVPVQEKILSELNVIPDYINEHMKTVLIVPEKTYIAGWSGGGRPGRSGRGSSVCI